MEIKLDFFIIVACVLIILDNVKGEDPVTQHKCVYKTDGKLKFCIKITKLDKTLLDNVTILAWSIKVRASDVIDFYRRCEYDWFDSRPDNCIEEFIILHIYKAAYLICLNDNRLRRLCWVKWPSEYCALRQPSTNRILHQSIPPAVYSTGIVFNLLILCVLSYKAKQSVTNLLLKILSVWDLMYLGSMLLESCLGHYTDQFIIKDISYAWLYIKYNVIPYSLRNYWDETDINVKVSTWSYCIMYWVHLTALVFQIASVYQTVIIATFRFIAIRRPFQASLLLTQRKAAAASVCCLLLGVILHLPSFIAAVSLPSAFNCEFKMIADGFAKYFQCKSNITSNPNNPLFAVSDEAFVNFYHIYHIILYTIFLFLALPFILLLLLNTLLLNELYTESVTPHDEENKAVTKVVIAIISIFLLTYIVKPAYTVDIYYFEGSLMNSIAMASCGGYFTASIIVIILPTLNSVVNLLIYLILRKTFRKQFVSMISFRRRN